MSVYHVNRRVFTIMSRHLSRDDQRSGLLSGDQVAHLVGCRECAVAREHATRLPEGYVLRRHAGLPDEATALIHAQLLDQTGAVRGRDLLPAARQAAVVERLTLDMSRRELLCLGLWRGDELAAFTRGCAYRPGALMMEVSVVAAAHRRRGLYSYLTRSVLSEARARGYLDVESSHVASNSPVLIAKLRLGFEVVGTEVSVEWGLSLIHI